MQDLRNQLEKIKADADDCVLISELATDATKRETFRRLADQLLQMSREIEQVIAEKLASGEIR